jgi:hypothetical protein
MKRESEGRSHSAMQIAARQNIRGHNLNVS